MSLDTTQDDRTSDTDDERIEAFDLLPPPQSLIRFFPIANTPVEQLVRDTRRVIRRILHGEDDRLLVVVGPCSIHDPKAALDYAARLARERTRLQGELELVMRVYFEKPRTTVGWKGLINDPYLDGSFRINEGLRMARHLLIDINRLGVPCAGELLDTISPQYISDLMSWCAIGARTTESQVHRELASGTSAPIGFKNGTDGNVRIASDAMLAARAPHHFLGVHKSGEVAMVRTRGNSDAHLILRGGKTPNYAAEHVRAAAEALRQEGLPARIMVDASHANSAKQHRRQLDVLRDVAQQLTSSDTSAMLFGVMLESHLTEGNQSYRPGLDDPAKLCYGQSITDACLGWEDTLQALNGLAQAVQARRARRTPA